ATINATEDGFAVLSVPNDPGWHVSINGTKTSTYQVNGGFMGIPIKAGYNEIYMSFIPRGLKVGISLTLIGTIITTGLIINNCLKQKKGRINL
ncbi:MAG: YfhO family protein, partial [Erysipelotrichaceae bacterium]|nr:YfhO family protein [Erysipelotrichaceae bacterium]